MLTAHPFLVLLQVFISMSWRSPLRLSGAIGLMQITWRYLCLFRVYCVVCVCVFIYMCVASVHARGRPRLTLGTWWAAISPESLGWVLSIKAGACPGDSPVPPWRLQTQVLLLCCKRSDCQQLSSQPQTHTLWAIGLHSFTLVWSPA